MNIKPFLYKNLYGYLLLKVMCVKILFNGTQQISLFRKYQVCLFGECTQENLKEKIFSCYMIRMLVENRTFHLVFSAVASNF